MWSASRASFWSPTDSLMSGGGLTMSSGNPDSSSFASTPAATMLNSRSDTPVGRTNFANPRTKPLTLPLSASPATR